MVSKQLYITALLIFCMSIPFISAHDITLSLELSDVHYTKQSNHQSAMPTVFEGDQFTLKVVISGKQQTGEHVSVTGLENFVVANALSIDSRVSSINNDLHVQKTISYPLRAKQPGIFVLGPATMHHNGTTLSSNSIQLFVEPAHKRSRVTIASAPQRAKSSLSQEAETFCTIALNKKSAFVGEPIILGVYIYTKGNVLQVGAPELPTLSNFTVKEIKAVKAYKEVKNGISYTIYPKLFVLFPTTDGTLTIDPIHIQYTTRAKPPQKRHRLSFFDDDFFSFPFGQAIEKKVAKSNSTKITVKALPEYSENIDAVGNFEQFQAIVDKKNVLVNEPIKLILSINGTGDLAQVETPILTLPDTVKYYESTNSIQEDLSKEYRGGTKQFEYVVQIPFGGNCTIPAQSFTYFDTKIKRYKTLKTEPITITVMAPTSPTQSQQATKPLPLTDAHDSPKAPTVEGHQDINFIEHDFTHTPAQKPPIPLWIFAVLLILIPIFLFRFHIKILLQPITSKIMPTRKLKLSIFQNKFEKYIRTNKPEKLYGLFISLFAQSHNISPAIITEDWIEKTLRHGGLEDEQISLFMHYLNQCAQLTFTTKKISQDVLDKLFEQGSYWLSTIYRIITKRNRK